MTKPIPVPSPRDRRFEDLTLDEAFNVGRVVAHLAEEVTVRRMPGSGHVLILTKYGRSLTMEELLAAAKRLSNTL